MKNYYKSPWITSFELKLPDPPANCHLEGNIFTTVHQHCIRIFSSKTGEFIHSIDKFPTKLDEKGQVLEPERLFSTQPEAINAIPVGPRKEFYFIYQGYEFGIWHIESNVSLFRSTFVKSFDGFSNKYAFRTNDHQLILMALDEQLSSTAIACEPRTDLNKIERLSGTFVAQVFQNGDVEVYDQSIAQKAYTINAPGYKSVRQSSLDASRFALVNWNEKVLAIYNLQSGRRIGQIPVPFTDRNIVTWKDYAFGLDTQKGCYTCLSLVSGEQYPIFSSDDLKKIEPRKIHIQDHFLIIVTRMNLVVYDLEHKKIVIIENLLDSKADFVNIESGVLNLKRLGSPDLGPYTFELYHWDLRTGQLLGVLTNFTSSNQKVFSIDSNRVAIINKKPTFFRNIQPYLEFNVEITHYSPKRIAEGAHQKQGPTKEPSQQGPEKESCLIS